MRHPQPAGLPCRRAVPGPRTLFVVAALLCAASAEAQNTTPFWSTPFGGSNRDSVMAIARGPGNLITIAGHTNSANLPVSQGTGNPTPLQSSPAGGFDAFVARLDPSQPPASQLLWCTYLGGTGDELVFDVEVDAIGNTTVVGVSESVDFPAPSGQASPTLNGLSDGFVAQIDVNGGALISAMFVGGSDHDRLCEVELEPGGAIAFVAGVTNSTDLPWTAGTVGPTAPSAGQTSADAFVARVLPAASLGLWATYLGGSRGEGYRYAGFLTNGGVTSVWEGNLDRMGLTLDPAGNPVLATVSNGGGTIVAQTTPNAFQPAPASGSSTQELYLAVIDQAGTSLHYATFFGGSGGEIADEVVAHPGGGFVVVGRTRSADLPVTPGCYQLTFQSCGASCQGTDQAGYVCHIDPAQGLRYSTYFDGDAGEDNIRALAVDSSGTVTIGGYSVGGNFPATPRAMQTTPGLNNNGFVARLAMRGQGSNDLLYATFLGGSGSGVAIVNGLVLDDYGNVFAAGSTTHTGFPTQNPFQTTVAGREGMIVHLPLLPGCTVRNQLASATPACGAPLYAGMGRAPVPGTSFELTATNAPPGSGGVLVLGFPAAPVPVPAPFNGTLLVTAGATVFVIADPLGGASFAASVPAGLSPVCPWGLAGQWLFLTNAACPGTGLLGTSARLEF